jgi:hypothetical protein
VILVNHTPSTVSGKVVAQRGDGEAARILPEGAEPVEQAGSGWAFELPGFTGALFEWRHV